MYSNRSLIYKKYTPWEPVPGEHLKVEPRLFDPEAPPPPGGITTKNILLSLDPYMRGQMRGPSDSGTYSIPWVEDEPAVVTGLSTVLKSDVPEYKPGDLVSGMASAGAYSIVTAEWMSTIHRFGPLPPGVNVAPAQLIGALGIAGLAAYESFFEYTKEPREGKTFFVSAASGGVGQIVGQIAKIHGMKVIGSTGSDEKAEFVTKELGFDGCWNYKKEKTGEALERLAPEGLDYYYDNVGGEQLETALTHMKDYGTIICSGAISVYHFPVEEKYGVKTLMEIFFKRLSLHGFICSDKHLLDKYMPTFGKDMVTWIAEGKIKTKEEIVTGIDNAPEAMVNMWRGDKFGKLILKLEEE